MQQKLQVQVLHKHIMQVFTLRPFVEGFSIQNIQRFSMFSNRSNTDNL